MAAPTRVGLAVATAVAVNDVTVDPSAPADGVAPSDGQWCVGVVAGIAYTDVTPPAGWVDLTALVTAGTLLGQVFAGQRQPGDTTYTFTSAEAVGTLKTAVVAWFDGADDVASWVAGTLATRAATGTALTNVAPSIDTTEPDTLVLTVSMERTLTDEAGAPVPDPAAFWYTTPGTIDEAILLAYAEAAAPGATGDVTITYPNSQASNGMAMQLGIAPPAAPAADAPPVIIDRRRRILRAP